MEKHLDDIVDENTMIKEYNDHKAFTGVILVAIFLGGLTLLTGVIYAITVIVLNLFTLIVK